MCAHTNTFSTHAHPCSHRRNVHVHIDPEEQICTYFTTNTLLQTPILFHRHTHTLPDTHTHSSTHTHTLSHRHTLPHTHSPTHTHTPTQRCTYTHTHTLTYTHLHTPFSFHLPLPTHGIPTQAHQGM